MQRYKIKIEYEGTPFVGWQFQKNGQSIQEVLQKAIFRFSNENVTVIGAGRTDSGVHALGQVAHFDLKKKMKQIKILPAINQNIGNKPITILKVNKVNKKFHARFDAKKRTYQYIIINRQSPLTLQKNKAWHIRKRLNIHALSPSPGAWFKFKKERFKVLKAKVSSESGKPGCVLDENLTIGCLKNSVQILELQRQGKNKQTSKEFLLGNKIDKGTIIT